MQFIVTEKQNRASKRQGRMISAANLAAAKCIASRGQFFAGTIIEISDVSGVLAVKENGKWKNVESK